MLFETIHLPKKSSYPKQKHPIPSLRAANGRYPPVNRFNKGMENPLVALDNGYLNTGNLRRQATGYNP